jgi:hypothetical protein
MATIQVNSFTVAIGTGSAAVLPKPAKFNKGRKCTRIRIRAAVSVHSTAAAYSFTSADLLVMFGAIFANLDIQFGDTDPEQIDSNMPFLMARWLYGVMEGHDFTVNNFAVGAVSGSNVQSGGVGTDVTLQLEYVRSFTLTREDSLHDFCPGYTQMTTIRLALTPSASAAPTFNAAAVTINSPAAVPVTVIFEDMPAENGADVWASVPKARQTTTPGIDIPLPIASGAAVIAIADFSATAAAYTLGLFQIFADGASIQGICSYAQFLASYNQDFPTGLFNFDIQSIVAPLYSMTVFDDVEHMETAESLVFEQPSNNIAAPSLVVAYVERISKQRRDQIGGNVAAKLGRGFKLATHAGAQGRNVAEPVAAVKPLAILSPSDNAYSLVPGVKYQQGSPPIEDIPANILGGANASAAATAGGIGSAAAHQATARAVRGITAAMPGYSSTNKQLTAPTNNHLAVLNSIVTHSSGSAHTVAGTAEHASFAQSRAQGVIGSILSRY